MKMQRTRWGVCYCRVHARQKQIRRCMISLWNTLNGGYRPGIICNTSERLEICKKWTEVDPENAVNNHLCSYFCILTTKLVVSNLRKPISREWTSNRTLLEANIIETSIFVQVLIFSTSNYAIQLTGFLVLLVDTLEGPTINNEQWHWTRSDSDGSAITVGTL